MVKNTSHHSTPTEGTTSQRSRVTEPFNEINEPGAYYNHETGWLYRIPEDMLSLGHSPVMNVVGNDEVLMTKIADDPWIPLNKARQICANLDFAVNF